MEKYSLRLWKKPGKLGECLSRTICGHPARTKTALSQTQTHQPIDYLGRSLGPAIFRTRCGLNVAQNSPSLGPLNASGPGIRCHGAGSVECVKHSAHWLVSPTPPLVAVK